MLSFNIIMFSRFVAVMRTSSDVMTVALIETNMVCSPFPMKDLSDLL